MKICFITLPKNISEGNILKPVFKSPPITYLWLSAILLRGGHSVYILDAHSLNLNEKDILQTIKYENPDIVGFTVFTNAFYDTVYVARKIKKVFPDVLIAVGGYHVNSMPTDFFLDEIDYIFTGESEYSLLQLMDRLDTGNKSKENIPGLFYRVDNEKKWVMNRGYEFKDNFDDMPILPYKMILNNGYTTWWSLIHPKRHKYMATVTGKGCPMKCSFCDISKTEGMIYRAMSAGRVLDEISYMSLRLGITHIEFRDTIFTVSIDRVTKIAQGIINRGLKIEWGFSSTIQRIKDPELLKLLYAAGCRFIFFGVESGNEVILKREKKIMPEKVFEVINIVKKAGIQPHCSFIFGLEGETEGTMKQTIDMALRLDPHTASFSIAVPYPGTKLYNSYKDKGYIKTYNWKLYGGEDPVFATELVSKEMLKYYLKKAHRSFYFRFSYIWRRLRSIRSVYEIKSYASIAFKMMFDIVAYKR